MAAFPRTLLLTLGVMTLAGCGTLVYVPEGGRGHDIRIGESGVIVPVTTPQPSEDTPTEVVSQDLPICREFQLPAPPELLPLPDFHPQEGRYSEQIVNILTRHVANLRQQYRDYMTRLDREYQRYHQHCLNTSPNITPP